MRGGHISGIVAEKIYDSSCFPRAATPCPVYIIKSDNKCVAQRARGALSAFTESWPTDQENQQARRGPRAFLAVSEIQQSGTWCPPAAARLVPRASISSTKMMHGAFTRARLNRSRTRAAPTPTMASTNSEPLIYSQWRELKHRSCREVHSECISVCRDLSRTPADDIIARCDKFRCVTDMYAS